jgi:SagB-type dehydrogenase family enzyme
MASSDALIAERHYENSKLTRATVPYMAERFGELDSRRAAEAFRTFPGAPRVRLPKQWLRPSMPLIRALRRRRSDSGFSGEPISLAELAEILRSSYGLTEGGRRAAPSAGALYPIELFPVCLRVKGVEPGFYHYHVREDVLERLAGDAVRSVRESVVAVSRELDCACLILMSAVWERSTAKYGERGYRFLMLDAGHLAQNLVLVATALELRSCPLGGFFEDRLAEEMGLDRAREWLLYGVAVGR